MPHLITIIKYARIIVKYILVSRHSGGLSWSAWVRRVDVWRHFLFVFNDLLGSFGIWRCLSVVVAAMRGTPLSEL